MARVHFALAALALLAVGLARASPHTTAAVVAGDDDLIAMSDSDYKHDLDLGTGEPEVEGAACVRLPRAEQDAPTGSVGQAQDEPSPQDEEGVSEKELTELWHKPDNNPSWPMFVASGFKRHFEQQYDKINAHLVAKLPHSQDFSQNMAELRDWYARERKRGVSILFNKATTEALRQLLDLARLVEPGVKCTRQAYKILWKNDQATRGLAYKPPSKQGNLRRVDLLVYLAAVNHSIGCFHVYPERWLETRRSMEERSLDLVETFFNNLLQSCDVGSSQRRRVTGKKAVLAAFDLIERNSHFDPDRRFLSKVSDEVRGTLTIKTSGVEALLERYLVKPCQKFVLHFGPDVFIPAQFGALVLEEDDRYDHSSGKFIQSWLHFRLCKSLIRRDKEKLLKDLVKYIKAHAK